MPTSKPPPPCVNNPVPKPKPKASPTPDERRAWAEIMNCIPRTPRNQWENAFGRDPDHDSEGAGLGISQPSSRVVVQGLVRDPDLPQPIVMGTPARLSPMTTMTTVDWESLQADDPWTQEPHTPREIVEF